ncbi:hypothetical protein HPB50_016439 [Hyalomma asiaticum]|uniref:Uncharacterized protein n=1 Tax=Hyalomma asiaticum TaxID=266040 RepID=A0ACB7T7M5_HYAAI|nr:hypothetical protein HPB50_016439 [Hyalomma asiaticum]
MVWDTLVETITRFGFPAEMITKNATYFTSEVLTDCHYALGIRDQLTNAYDEHTIIIERVNQNLMSGLVAHTE